MPRVCKEVLLSHWHRREYGDNHFSLVNSLYTSSLMPSYVGAQREGRQGLAAGKPSAATASKQYYPIEIVSE